MLGVWSYFEVIEYYWKDIEVFIKVIESYNEGYKELLGRYKCLYEIIYGL